MTCGPRGEVDVLCAVRGPHEERFAEGLATRTGDVRIIRRCADIAELVSVAHAGTGHIALVSDDHNDLNRQVIAELQGLGVGVLALTVQGDAWRADRMRALGALAVAGIDVGLDELRELVLDAATGAGAQRLPASISLRPDGGPHRTPDLAGALRLGVVELDAAPLEVTPHDDPPRTGIVVTVWGTGGSPGRTTLAINVATELGAAMPGPARTDVGQRSSPRGWRHASARNAAERLAQGGAEARWREQPPEVLLVDADTYNPSLAQHLALLDESAGLALAARAASNGTLDLARLAELTPRIDRHLRVLTGIGRPSRWPEVPAISLEAVWNTARELADVTVIDTGAVIERDEALSYDTRAPQRNGATTSALEAADVLIIVALPDPVGVQRLVRAMSDLAESGLDLAAQRIVVVNRVRTGAVGSQPLATLRDALHRHIGITVDEFVPEHQDAFDAALLAGRTLAEAAAHSPARRAIADLAARVSTLRAGALAGG